MVAPPTESSPLLGSRGHDKNLGQKPKLSLGRLITVEAG